METPNVLRISQVVDVNDEYDGQRIRARVLPEDQGLATNEIPYAFPLLPKMLHVVPKVGEAVLVLTTLLDDGNSQRYYIGPIVHQPQFMNHDNFAFGATTLLSGAIGQPSAAPSTNPDALGAYPELEDTAIQGRGDSDIILGEKDLKIRCGVHLTDESDKTDVKFNRTTPSYIKMKYHVDPLSDGKNSTTTIVSEHINLLSTASKEYFDLSNKDELVTDDVMEEILKKAHVLPYGDILVDFLKLFIKAFQSHTHPYSGMPPCQDLNYKAVDQFDMNTMLSENIRIN